ncbi:hypothetical protein EG329_009894, partial [Mollisiaceae sp. DMI_Dod_QoI]
KISQILQQNIENVEAVFKDLYHFEIFNPDPAQQGWKIPIVNSHAQVWQAVEQMIGLDEPSTLNIVYYNGHGMQFNNELILQSDSPSAQEYVIWGGLSGIQQLLVNARCHALVLLDCCCATSVNFQPVSQHVQIAGPSWQLAASSYNHLAWTGSHSLTSMMVEQLQILSAIPQGFDIHDLHSLIIVRLSRLSQNEIIFTQAPVLSLLTYNVQQEQKLWLKPHTTALTPVDYGTTVAQFLKISQPRLSVFGIWAFAWGSDQKPHAIVALFDTRIPSNYISRSLVNQLNLEKKPIGGATFSKIILFTGERGETLATEFVQLYFQLDASKFRLGYLEAKFYVVNSDYGGRPFDLRLLSQLGLGDRLTSILDV